jgi:hypothetical protein
MRRNPWRWIVGAVIVLGLGYGVLASQMCIGTYLRYGIVISSCPSGKLRQTVEMSASGLRRGAKGTVTIKALAHYMTSETGERESHDTMPIQSLALALVDSAGQAQPLAAHHKGGAYEITLPDVHDGDYLLRATVKTRLDTTTVARRR